MASPKISFRVPEETYGALLKLAEIEHKTVAELSRELLEVGMGKRTTPDMDILTRLQFLEMTIAEMMARGVKASAVAAYYAKLATETTDEATHFITTSGQILDNETKVKRAKERQKRSREIAQHFLTAPLEQI